MLHSQFHTLHPACDCLVNTWVGTKGRWALLDLTAGGKDWGPALGGDGTVHHHTLPHVHDMFGELKKMKDGGCRGRRQGWERVDGGGRGPRTYL